MSSHYSARPIEQKRAGGACRRFITDSHNCQAWADRLEPGERDILGDTSSGDADCALGIPTRLEGKGRVRSGVGFLDVEIVPHIDDGAITRPAAAVAAIVRAHHADAGIVMGAHRPPVRRFLPRAIAEAQRSIDYLRREIKKTELVGVQTVIYRLVETQINNIMLAEVRDEYAFRVIDPAVAALPDDYVRPKPLLMAIAAAFLGLGLGVFLATMALLIARNRLERQGAT